jgi:predicted CoA-binding protein
MIRLHGMTEINDSLIRTILTRTKRIALVGASANPVRPSHGVMRFLRAAGYEVVPVNPGLAGKTLLGQPVVASLSEIEGHIDMIDIFRAPEHVAGIVDEALEHFADLATIWMQIGVVDEAAAAKARARGVDVVMNRCPKIEHARLMGSRRSAQPA